ncbi:MAG TPA: cyclic dehypoxanthinyl futalosine synthase [Candidatus Omnitrophota bacterium]|nr:cyclic dehypoxanthinyl futalosine synthase [Candidatus Omnitrophota bacterium]
MKAREEEIFGKISNGERLTREDGIELYRADLAFLGCAASRVRRRLHPSNRVTFVLDRNIYLTNICVAQCSFCAFSRDASGGEGYVLSHEEILAKVRELADAGGTQVMIQGGLNPELGLEYYAGLVRKIRAHFPRIHVHSFSPPEIDMLARREGMSDSEVLSALKRAGLNSLPGGGAEILADRVRSVISPKKISAEDWIKVMRSAHGAGLRSTATMVFGHVETLEERISHLLRLRDLQDETGGFRAFICWSLSPRKTPGLRDLRMTGGWDYLRTVAVARLMLDNIPNIQSGWVTEGHRLAQAALEFGANDMGGVLTEELVISPTGIGFETAAEEMVRLIRQSGYQPVQRDTNYAVVKEFDS